MKSIQLTTKIFKGFLKFKAKRPTPLFASYNVTGRCNMKCVFCKWSKVGKPELPTNKALEVIDAVCSIGVPFFDLSGGEPLLRKDIHELAKRAASHGCMVSMNTNGTLLNEGRLSKLVDVLDLVVVSLDGPKEIHDKIRGVPGTYDKTVQAITLLKTQGIKLGINSVVTPWNIDILPNFIEKIRNQVDFAQIQPIHPYPPPPENVPSDKQIDRLVNYLVNLKRIDPGFLAVPTHFLKGFKLFFKGKIPKICHAGELYVAIDPSGKLLACPARSDIIIGDASNYSVNSLLRETRDSEGWRKVSACRGCWLECTAGVSIMLKKPLKEVSQLVSLWRSH